MEGCGHREFHRMKTKIFGVHDEIAEHYKVPPGTLEPHATTLDYIVAATAG